ncbi:MAG: DUF3365 domain-containing protein, partial [SAR324 cluster bacterium]|nr:DUF3365 domain-containing protein [SAR324 cluster bacterium]
MTTITKYQFGEKDLQRGKKNYLGSQVFWLTVLLMSLSFVIYSQVETTKKMAINSATSNLNKDLALRLWATKHGGIYVPVDERTPANVHLAHIKERDIETLAGKKLTLMNPAYMIRQIHDEASTLYGITGTLTSLKLLNKNNAPDPWERAALLAFEKGSKEV